MRIMVSVLALLLIGGAIQAWWPMFRHSSSSVGSTEPSIQEIGEIAPSSEANAEKLNSLAGRGAASGGWPEKGLFYLFIAVVLSILLWGLNRTAPKGAKK